MRSIHRLRRLFQTAAAASLAVACGGSAASDPGAGAPTDDPTNPLGGTPTGNKIDRTGFVDSVCVSSTGGYDPLDGLTSNPAFDALEVRVQTEPNAKVADGAMFGRQSTGTACKTATDTAKCKSSFESLTATGWRTGGMMESYTYYVYTRGDEVAALESIDALRKFLLPIDTAKDAAMILSLEYKRVSCAGPNVRRAANGGFDVVTTQGDGCGATNDVVEKIVNVSPGGEVSEISSVVVRKGEPGCSHGRRPEGLGPMESSPKGLAGFLCEMTHLEAASVHAFDRLARELEAHGAPARLVREARRAQRDEIKHTKMAAKLARRSGGAPREPEVPSLPARDLFSIALENATEGCVAETFAALLARVQSHRASDPAIRRAMAIIAEDETRHAALAWDVAEWIESQLTSEQREAIAVARRAAASALRESHVADFDSEIQTRAGMPSASETRALVDAIRSELWAA